MTLAYNPNLFQDEDSDVAIGRRTVEKTSSRRRRNDYSRGHNRPAVHNGIHRRRNKKFTW